MKTISAEKVIKAFKLEGKPFAILDFETSSSKDGNVGMPIQVGALRYDEQHNLTELSKYVNQGRYNPETDMIQTKDKFFSITDLTGVTKDHLQSPEYKDQRISECELVQYGFTDGLIIGYNIAYDVRTLKEAYKRCGLPFEYPRNNARCYRPRVQYSRSRTCDRRGTRSLPPLHRQNFEKCQGRSFPRMDGGAP